MHVSNNDSSNLPKFEADFRFSLHFREPNGFYGFEEEFEKNLTEFLCFAFDCISFGSLILSLNNQR